MIVPFWVMTTGTRTRQRMIDSRSARSTAWSRSSKSFRSRRLSGVPLGWASGLMIGQPRAGGLNQDRRYFERVIESVRERGVLPEAERLAVTAAMIWTATAVGVAALAVSAAIA